MAAVFAATFDLVSFALSQSFGAYCPVPDAVPIPMSIGTGTSSWPCAAAYAARLTGLSQNRQSLPARRNRAGPIDNRQCYSAKSRRAGTKHESAIANLSAFKL